MRITTLAIFLLALMGIAGATNAADPGEARETKKIPIDLPEPRDPDRGYDPRSDRLEIKGFETFLRERKMEAPVVGDPSVIVLDVYIAGLNPAKTKLPPLERRRPFNVPDTKWANGLRDIYASAQREWQRSEKGANGVWTITPRRLYIGKLRFAFNGDLGFCTGLANTRFGEKGQVKVPVMIPNADKPDGFDYLYKEIGYQPSAHFILAEAYWVYEARRGDETEYFAIELNNVARTTLHCPFGPEYDRKIREIREAYPRGILGRPMEEVNMGMIGGETAMYGLPGRGRADWMPTCAEALEQMPAMVKVGTWADVERNYPGIGKRRFVLPTK